MTDNRHFLPAAGKDLFLPLYDPLTRLMGFDRVHNTVIEQAELTPAHHVLDVGCGTGSLAVRIKRSLPAIDIVGLDPDPKALERARKKAKRAGVSVRFERGFADLLPFADACFDRVLSSMMFHHLKPDLRPKMLCEIFRVLRPGGQFHMVDFSGEAHGLLARLFHSHNLLRDNAEDRILARMTAAGFVSARRTRSESLLFGGIAYYEACRR